MQKAKNKLRKVMIGPSNSFNFPKQSFKFINPKAFLIFKILHLQLNKIKITKLSLHIRCHGDRFFTSTIKKAKMCTSLDRDRESKVAHIWVYRPYTYNHYLH